MLNSTINSCQDAAVWGHCVACHLLNAFSWHFSHYTMESNVHWQSPCSVTPRSDWSLWWCYCLLSSPHVWCCELLSVSWLLKWHCPREGTITIVGWLWLRIVVRDRQLLFSHVYFKNQNCIFFLFLSGLRQLQWSSISGINPGVDQEEGPGEGRRIQSITLQPSQQCTQLDSLQCTL